MFWQTNGLNELADAGDFTKITRRINGGTNGLADRQMYYARAKTVLSTGFIAEPAARGETRSRERIGRAAHTWLQAISRSERAVKAAAARTAKSAPLRRAKA